MGLNGGTHGSNEGEKTEAGGREAAVYRAPTMCQAMG